MRREEPRREVTVVGEDPSRAAAHERRRLELEADLQWLERARRRDNVRMAAGVVLSLVVAVPMMAMSAHVTTEAEGRLWLYGGLILGDAGVLASIGWGLWRTVERGDAAW